MRRRRVVHFRHACRGDDTTLEVSRFHVFSAPPSSWSSTGVPPRGSLGSRQSLHCFEHIRLDRRSDHERRRAADDIDRRLIRHLVFLAHRDPATDREQTSIDPTRPGRQLRAARPVAPGNVRRSVVGEHDRDSAHTIFDHTAGHGSPALYGPTPLGCSRAASSWARSSFDRSARSFNSRKRRPSAVSCPDHEMPMSHAATTARRSALPHRSRRTAATQATSPADRADHEAYSARR